LITYRGITVDDLHRMLDITNEGALFWKIRTQEQFSEGRKISAKGACSHWNKTRAGKEAFTSRLKSGKKLFRGRICGKDFMKSWVVFAMSRGAWPDGFIIHLNDDVTDFRPENLAEISPSTKTAMSKKAGGKHTNFVGVYLDTSGGGKARKDGKEWCCYFDGKYIGNFDLPIDAAIAYDKKVIEKHGQRAKTNLIKMDGIVS